MSPRSERPPHIRSAPPVCQRATSEFYGRERGRLRRIVSYVSLAAIAADGRGVGEGFVGVPRGRHHMATITTADGTEIFYKDWGSGQPIVFSHGWPLSADDWDTQM